VSENDFGWAVIRGPGIDVVVLADSEFTADHQPDPESASVIFKFSTTKGITLDELLVEDCGAVESGVRV
jgi:hypothetical protein